MEHDEIIAIASELGEMLRENETVKEFYRLQEILKNDRVSQELLASLIRAGAELSEKASKGEEVKLDQNAEYGMLQIEIEKNSVVKEFITAQKEYFALLKKVQDIMRDQLK